MGSSVRIPMARTSQQLTSKVRVQRRASRQPVSRRACSTSPLGITCSKSSSLSSTRLASPGGKVLSRCSRFFFAFIAASWVWAPQQTQDYGRLRLTATGNGIGVRRASWPCLTPEDTHVIDFKPRRELGRGRVAPLRPADRQAQEQVVRLPQRVPF